MKYFTIFFSLLLVIGFVGTIIYVGLSPEFVPPGSGMAANGEDPDAPVWDMDMEDMLDYLEAEGFVNREEILPIAAGVATEGAGFHGAEIYWWDLDNLKENSPEARAYQEMAQDGSINVFGMGSYMAVIKNGPFGMGISHYDGDADALEAAFRAFGQK